MSANDNHNNHNNGGYGNKSHHKKTNSASKSAYEIRTDVLKLALEMHLANLSVDDGKFDAVSAKDVVTTANTFNDFISKKNDK